MSCSSLTSCQHGHVRTLSSTDEHVFARLGWIHDPVCSVALPTAVIPFTFRACPRSAVCCRIKPYHFCIQPGPRPRSPPRRTPPPPAEPWAEPAESPLPGAAARGARAGAPCATRCGCPPAGGRAHARAGGGGEEGTGAGRGGAWPRGWAARDSRLGGNRDTTVEFETADSSVPARRRPRLHARRDRAVMRQGPSPKTASYLNERKGKPITVPPAAAFGSGRACCTCCSFRELGCVLGTGAARVRY